jgi:hypothetical protein
MNSDQRPNVKQRINEAMMKYGLRGRKKKSELKKARLARERLALSTSPQQSPGLIPADFRNPNQITP